MAKKSRSKPALKVDPYLEGFMTKLLDRFVALEKKMDAVLAQTAGKPSGNSAAPKPFQNVQPVQPPRRERTMYEAICADCSKVCEVPFKPSEDRAVYCKACFAKRKSGGFGHGMPVLTPVTLPPKPKSTLNVPSLVSAPAQASKRSAKKKPAQKGKKSKR